MTDSQNHIDVIILSERGRLYDASTEQGATQTVIEGAASECLRLYNAGHGDGCEPPAMAVRVIPGHDWVGLLPALAAEIRKQWIPGAQQLPGWADPTGWARYQAEQEEGYADQVRDDFVTGQRGW